MQAAESPVQEDAVGGTREALLSVKGLNAWYGAAQILFNVDLDVTRGEVVALMGRNGAGKSTTFKAIMGLLPKRQGTLSFMGKDISSAQTHDIAASGLGFVPEDRRIFTDLSVLENLEVGRQGMRHWPDKSPAPLWTPELLFKLFPNLGEMPNRPGGRPAERAGRRGMSGSWFASIGGRGTGLGTQIGGCRKMVFRTRLTRSFERKIQHH